MQVVLAAMFLLGLVRLEPKVLVNSGIALGITFLPAALERNYRLPLDPWLAGWVTVAVFLHTLGSAGFYGYFGWWDHLTHAFSATLIAGIGYITVRALELHHAEILLPRRFAFVYIVTFVIAFGVVWELFEYGLDALSAATGLTMPLAQRGLDDTVIDLMFNTFGAVLVATFGQLYLGETAELLRRAIFDRGRTG